VTEHPFSALTPLGQAIAFADLFIVVMGALLAASVALVGL
jgi:hypothetical protein